MTKTIKVLIIIIFSLFAIILVYTSNRFFVMTSPSAIQGKMNLSSWDFNEDGMVKLDGEWECYDNQLLTPEDFNQAVGSKPQLTGYIKPTADRLENSFKPKLDPKGVRTYRLIVKVKPTEEPFGIKIDNIRMSNKLYINGEAEGSCGNPEKENQGYQPRNAPYNSYFDIHGDRLEILLQTANFEYPFRSYLYTVILGSEKNINFQEIMSSSVELSGAVLSFFFGLYYMCLYYNGKRDKGMLYAAFQFFSLAILLLSTGQKLIYGFLPEIPFELFCKIQLLSLIGVPASTVAFVNFSEKRIISDFLKRIVFTIFLLYFVIIITMNYRISAYLNGFIYAFIFIIYLYIILKLWWAYKKTKSDDILRTEILLYILCTTCLLIALSNNFLYNLTWSSTKAIGSAGLCGFVLFSQIFLAFRFSVNYDNMVKLDKLKDEFMMQTSYQLKAPLKSILNISEHMMKENLQEVCSRGEYLKNAVFIKSMVQRLLNIVNTSLDVTLLQNDQLKLKISPIDIKVCIDLAIESVKDHLDNRKVEIISDLEESLFVEADENRVRQVLRNLILNSVKSMERGTIWIQGKQEKGMACISVEDDGCGIPKEKWEEIFQPYMTLKSQGIGVGLYVTRHLARLMNGKVYVEWSEINKGSRFVLLLPSSIKKGHASSKEERKRASRLDSPHQLLSEKCFSYYKKDEVQDFKNTVLVVDDEIFNIQTAAYILRTENYRVLTALSGEEALQIVKTQTVDLIILDVLMPKDSGISICKKIRETYSLIELPILISVVGMESHDLSLGLAAGANDFILKPFQKSEIKARVKTLIELKKSIEEAMKSELAFLQAQIKPHFLYNAINTMVSFCYTDSEKAAKLLTDFSKYLRLSFDVDHKLMMIPLSRELELIHAYTAIEQARFGDKIKIQYDIDPELLNMEIPPLCIQPLVENSIKHGLCKKPDGGVVFISVKKKENNVWIEIRDTGLGMTEERLHSLKSMDNTNGGIGFSNINKRMKRWNQSQIDIRSLPEVGTTVTIMIKPKM